MRSVLLMSLALLGLFAGGSLRAADAVCGSPKQLAEVAVPDHPFSALPSADGCWLFVSTTNDDGHGSVLVFRDHAGTFSLEHTLALKTSAYGEALSHDGKTLAVAGGRATSVVDVARMEQGDAQAVLSVLYSKDERGGFYSAISNDD